MLRATILAAGVFVSALLAAVPLLAQQQASIIGTVTDESKAVLPGVTVTATNIETGTQAVGVTDEHGEYRIIRLQPGTYKIQAELASFASVVVPKVELLVGQNATVPFVMKLAQLSETLTVTAEAPLVDTSSSQVTGNVDRRQMENLPLQGRNWMELSKLVKGVTANDISNSIGNVDDMWQLNLDGQQITQKLAGSGFGQPRFSRESIAEFQIITNMFDITQGRSAGLEVQAVSKSGTNTTAGSVYGYFRNDKLNAADPVAHKVLPYSNQQVGGTLGGPIVKDKLHYFASYEYEREPGTVLASTSLLPGESWSVPYKNGQQSFLGRVDDQLSMADRLSIRGSRWDWKNPFVYSAGDHPSHASNQTKDATNILGTWSHVYSGGTRVQEIKFGYNTFHWSNDPQSYMLGVPEFRIAGGFNVGAPYNYPQTLMQDNFDARYDLNWHKSSHDIKLGAEYIHVHDTGPWYIQRAGFFNFASVPANLTSLFTQDNWNQPSTWNMNALAPYVRDSNINFTQGDWTIDVPRPTYAIWFGDNWHMTSNLTVNMGIRWDGDPRVADPPDIVENSILIDMGLSSNVNSRQAGTADYGYKSGIRDWKDWAPRAGFTYNVAGRNDLVIRGGTGLYYASPVSNVTFSPQLYSQLVSAIFTNDGRADFVTNPTSGLTTAQIFSGSVKLPAQVVRTIMPGFRSPYTWQSSIGFQKQINDITGFDVDLTHYTEYRDTRTFDANMFYNPATGYNAPVSAGRPNPAYGPVFVFTSDGKREQTQLASSLTRRMKNNFQAGVTWTLMLEMRDNGAIGYGSQPANNPFDYLNGEWATAEDFQRNTVRVWAMYNFPWGFSTSVSYFYGSGNRFNNIIGTAPYGKTGNNRLNLTATGGATNAITIPASVLDRWNGPAVINSGDVIPRNALQGLPLHKVDLHVTKDFALGGNRKASLILEVFNLFNHNNYGSYNRTLSATSAATTALFGTPLQNTGNAYVPREAQVGFRFGF